MTPKEAEQIVGGLSKPSKMPCPGYSIPAAVCKVGGNLRKIPGSVCSKCYAHKGMYRFGNVQTALYRRLGSLNDPRWVQAMVTLILARKMPYFRWHDSGDLQNETHLNNIISVAEQTPDCQHWLPTKEYSLIQKLIASGKKIPKNLVVRVSSPMIDTRPLLFYSNTSTVHSTANNAFGHVCQAAENSGKCGDCRVCWDPGVKNVSYKAH